MQTKISGLKSSILSRKVSTSAFRYFSFICPQEYIHSSCALFSAPKLKKGDLTGKAGKKETLEDILSKAHTPTVISFSDRRGIS